MVDKLPRPPRVWQAMLTLANEQATRRQQAVVGELLWESLLVGVGIRLAGVVLATEVIGKDRCSSTSRPVMPLT